MRACFISSCIAFILSVALSSRLPFRVENEQLTDVTSQKQLWRFLVGDGRGFTVGNRYICLRTNKDRVVSASSDTLYRSGDCYSSARFEIEFQDGNGVLLKSSNSRRYVSCANDGTARVTDWKDDSAVFHLRISKDEDRLVLYNPKVDGTLSSLGRGSIDCNGFESDPASKFYGWKLGAHEAWEASDDWQMIGYFDNRYSSSETEFVYATSVGVEDTHTTKARVPDGFLVNPGPDLFSVFTESISEKSDIAWKYTPPNVWRESTELKSTIKVSPNTLTKLYQAVGHYGVFTIRSGYVQARDEEDTVRRANLLEK